MVSAKNSLHTLESERKTVQQFTSEARVYCSCLTTSQKTERNEEEEEVS